MPAPASRTGPRRAHPLPLSSKLPRRPTPPARAPATVRRPRDPPPAASDGAVAASKLATISNVASGPVALGPIGLLRNPDDWRDGRGISGRSVRLLWWGCAAPVCVVPGTAHLR